MSDDEPRFARVPGRLMRTLKTSRLTGLVGSSYLGGQLLDRLRSAEDAEAARTERHLKNARRIVSAMSELRGPMMKLGQLLSTHREALPGEFVDALSTLQSKAPPMPWGDVRRQIHAALGAWPEEVFVSIEPEAFAAASIGQVHRAVAEVDGAPVRVAVKVQYPAADSMVEADLRSMGSAVGLVKGLASDLAGQGKLDFTPVFEEISEHLRQETDYTREAFNAQLLRAVLAEVPEVVVPRVFNAYSSFTVITYELLEGVTLQEFLATPGASAARRLQVTETLARAFWTQLFRNGVMHADPHPGNYLVLPDGRLGLLDFGCVKLFSERWTEAFSRLVRARIAGDAAAEIQAIRDLELVDDPDDAAELEDMRRIGDYFSAGLLEDKPCRFGADFDYMASGRGLIQHFLQARRIPKSQRDFVFLTRVILSLYDYFSRLDAEMNYHRLAMPYLEGGWQGRRVVIPGYYLGEEGGDHQG